ncbi:MAG: XRE family transcriptional regulator [Anaerolineaceae bacterium]|jgi:transcriptional regulator with XRE-family HTH domain|nr:MAG: XRE family transcriptional regulator [Anaerolineaceae bacterium]
MINRIGANVRKIRQGKGISQDCLSKMSDLSLNTIVKIETGESPNPTIETLEKISNALDVSITELFKD